MKGPFTFVAPKEVMYYFVQWAESLQDIDCNVKISTVLKKGALAIKRDGKINFKTKHKNKTGNLVKSFTTKFKKRKDNQSAYAGFKRNANKKQGDKIGGGNHVHLIDRGTVKRVQYTTGRKTGSISRHKPQQGSLFWTAAVVHTGSKQLNQLKNTLMDILRKKGFK